VWRRDSDGLVLTFHLAGINNQNFIMRDEETGTYWQQITGIAISGPLAGRHLTLVSSDELTFALWKAEEPDGAVLQDVSKYASDYSKKDWDVKMKKAPTVLSFAQPGLEPRTLVLGIQAFGAARAVPYDDLMKSKLVQDRVGSEPVLLVVGPDGHSIRAFRDRIPGVDGAPAFYRTLDDSQAHPTDAKWLAQAATAPLLMDESTGGQWNFQGCALTGKSQGVCLEKIEAIKDYWFDWRNYHPDTTVFTQRK